MQVDSSITKYVCIGVLILVTFVHLSRATDEIEKRAPGWGKRDLQNSLSDLTDNLDQTDKRAPGWGKRGLSLSDYMDENLVDKRAPGWGKRASEGSMVSAILKRAPGWGKRSQLNSYMDKRAPGWGKRSMRSDEYEILHKRAPGWGKRATEMDVKRAPGWGKRSDDIVRRAPGWGKRAPGWGKRSGNEDVISCSDFEDEVNFYLDLAIEAESKRLACSAEEL